jgi:acetyltransferase-like isoleucine patch superfamily enzyme
MLFIIHCNNKQFGSKLILNKNVKIVCDSLIIGDEVIIEDGTDIYLNGQLKIGDLSTLGHHTIIRGNNVSIGSEFFSDGELEIGGGGWYNPDSNLTIGDRCVMHNNHININCPIKIGNHVGLSPNVDLITHGYWQSVLEGFPFREGPIVIKDNVIVGRNSIILPKVTICENAVIGAGSVVTKEVLAYHVVGGIPAKTIYIIKPNQFSIKEKEKMAKNIIDEYKKSLEFRNIKDLEITMDYPKIFINNATFNLENETYNVKIHTDVTDDFRDFMRRKGIWFYGRRFKSIRKDLKKSSKKK